MSNIRNTMTDFLRLELEVLLSDVIFSKAGSDLAKKNCEIDIVRKYSER